MSDEQLRRLERAWLDSHDREDQLAWLRARAKAGLARHEEELLVYRTRRRVHIVGSRHMPGWVYAACGRRNIGAAVQDRAQAESVEWDVLGPSGLSFPNRKRGIMNKGTGPIPWGWCVWCVGATRKRRKGFGGKLLQAAQRNALTMAFDEDVHEGSVLDQLTQGLVDRRPIRHQRYHRWKRKSARGGPTRGAATDRAVCGDCGLEVLWQQRLFASLGRENMCAIRHARLGPVVARHYYNEDTRRTLCGRTLSTTTGDHARVNLLLSGHTRHRAGDCVTCREELPKVLR